MPAGNLYILKGEEVIAKGIPTKKTCLRLIEEDSKKDSDTNNSLVYRILSMREEVDMSKAKSAPVKDADPVTPPPAKKVFKD